MSSTSGLIKSSSRSGAFNITISPEGHFDPISFLNETFPNDGSLDRIDEFVISVSEQVALLDNEMSEAAQLQALVPSDNTTTAHVTSAISSVEDLFVKMSEIATKANHSEMMVQHLCADIRQLDNAKRNLELSFNTMKRLQILLNAVEQLELVVADKAYNVCAGLVDAISKNIIHFEKYTQVPLVIDLQTRFTKMTVELKKQMHRVFREMSQLLEVGIDLDSAPSTAEIKNSKSFASSCALVDTLGQDFLAEVIQEFVEMQLIAYDSLFSINNKQYCGLDQIDRRWAWLKRLLKTFDLKFANIFPIHWNVQIRLCISFYDKTIEHLQAVLAENEAKRTDAIAEVPTLLKAVTSSMKFELEMCSKFEISRIDDESTSTNMNSTHNPFTNSPKSPASQLVKDEIIVLASKKLPKSISSVFDRYLGPYVLFERKNLEELLIKLRQEEDKTSGSSSHRSVFDSSMNMFVYIRNSIKRCTGFTNGQTFLSLCKEFKTCMHNYADLLRTTKCSVPAQNKNVSYEVDLCYVINTAEYCSEVIPNIEQMIKQKLPVDLVDHINFATEVDAFSDLVAYSLKCLVTSCTERIEPAFKMMSQIHWGSIADFDGESDYCRMFQSPLAMVLPSIYTAFTQAYYNNLCLKLSTEILKNFLDIILRQKKISDSGAQQLLLDTYSLKQLLAKLHHLGVEGNDSEIIIPSMYTKLVNTRVAHIENILKLISTPEEHLRERFKNLWPLGTESDLQMINNMKISKKQSEKGGLVGDTLNKAMESLSQTSMSSFSSSARSAIDNLKDKLAKN